jgi:hypothetical protein
MKRRYEWNIELVFYAGLALVALLLSAAANWASCSAQWEGSGMRTKWGPVSGCLVRRADGAWIPSGAFRDVLPSTREKQP